MSKRSEDKQKSFELQSKPINVNTHNAQEICLRYEMFTLTDVVKLIIVAVFVQ